MRASCLVVMLASVLAACSGGSSNNNQAALDDYFDGTGSGAGCADFGSRSLVYSYPSPGQTEVMPLAPVVLRFTHPISETSAASAASRLTLTNVKTSTTVAFVPKLVDGGRTIMLQPTGALVTNTSFRVAGEVTLKDDCADSTTKGSTGTVTLGSTVLQFTTRPALSTGALNAQARNASKFQVENLLPDAAVFPLSRLSGGVPVTDFATLRLQLSQPVKADTALYGTTVKLVDNTTALSVPATLLVNGNHVSVDPLTDLDSAKTYTLSLTTGLKSVSGQSMTAWSKTFKPADTGGPKAAAGSGSSAGDGDHQVPVEPYICSGLQCDKRAHLKVHVDDGGGPSALTGTTINQVPVASPLLGSKDPLWHVADAKGSTLFADLGVSMNLMSGAQPVSVAPLRIARNNLLEASALVVKLDGKVPAGLETGKLRIRLLTDANGLLLPNKYGVAKEAPSLVMLEMDIALGAEDSTSNGAFTQSLLHVPVTGIASIKDGKLTIEAMGVIELDVLGVDKATAVLALKLTSTPAEDGGTLGADTIKPLVQSWVPGNRTTSGLPAGDLLRPGDPIIVNFDKAMDASSFKAGTTVTLQRDGAAEPFSMRVDGHSLIITPTTPLVHGSTYSLTLGEVKDLAGNTLGPVPAALQPLMFTLPALSTSKIRPPVVLSVYPGFPCALSSSGRDLSGGKSGRCAGGKSSDDVLPLPSMDPQRDLQITLSQSINPASVKLGTACNAAASFRVERIDASGNCQAVVPGQLNVRPREIAFKPSEPWVKDQLYRYVLGSNGSLTSSTADCSGTQAICGSNGLPLQTQLIAQTLADAQNSQRGGPNMEIFFKGGAPLGGTSIGLRVLPVLDVNANFRLDDGETRSLRIDESGNYIGAGEYCRTGQGTDVPATTGRCVAANGALLQPDRITNGSSFSGAATRFSLGCGSESNRALGAGSEDENATAGRDCQGNQFLLISASLGARLGSSITDGGQDAIEVFINPSMVVTSGAMIYADLGITPTATPITNALCGLPLANLICSGGSLLTSVLDQVVDSILPIKVRDQTNLELPIGQLYTGPLVFRMRYPADGGPIKGTIKSVGGKLILESQLDLYTDIPEINAVATIAGQPAIPIEHKVRSSTDLTSEADLSKGSGSVKVRGEVKFLPDGRMTVQLANKEPVRLTADLSGLGELLAGALKVRVPTGRFIIDASLAPIKPAQ